MSMSIADAIRRYHEIKISVASVGMEPLDEETSRRASPHRS